MCVSRGAAQPLLESKVHPLVLGLWLWGSITKGWLLGKWEGSAPMVLSVPSQPISPSSPTHANPVHSLLLNLSLMLSPLLSFTNLCLSSETASSMGPSLALLNLHSPLFWSMRPFLVCFSKWTFRLTVSFCVVITATTQKNTRARRDRRQVLSTSCNGQTRILHGSYMPSQGDMADQGRKVGPPGFRSRANSNSPSFL